MTFDSDESLNLAKASKSGKELECPIWKQKALAKRETLLSKIPLKWRLSNIPPVEKEPDVGKFLDKILPEAENSITSSSVIDLANRVSSGLISSKEVAEAFCHRAALVHQITSCCSEIFFDKAIERAQYLDDYYKKNGKTVGPLHGIPVSLKDQFNLEGIETSIGFIGLLGKPTNKSEVSNIVEILNDLGAIFYVKTTVPMAMLSYETVSNLHGTTTNSLNRKLSCGGSSGGEGALIGAKGSIIGFGTDIGGSIRTPCAFQGLYGIKPSYYRLPYRNVTNSAAYQPIIPSVIGPMTRKIEDLEFVMKLIVNSKPWLTDPKVLEINWKETSLKSGKLAFGIMEWDELIYPHPPVIRALKIVKEKLLSAGHEVIVWKPQNHSKILNLVTSVFTCDALEEVKTLCSISKEPLTELIQKSFNPPKRQLTVSEFFDLARIQYEVQQAYDDYWNSTSKETTTGQRVDAWISPAWESTSFRVGEGYKTPSRYTRYLNALNYAIVVAPITKVNKNIDVPLVDYKAVSTLDKINQEYYDPDLYDGMPVNLQIVTHRYEEEKAISLTKMLTDLL